MNTYHCMIDLRDNTKALAFAKAMEDWMMLLKDRGVIEDWRLMRRKLNLADQSCLDFLLEIDVRDMTQLDQAFRVLGAQDDTVADMHNKVHQMIATSRNGLYRPFPDPERAERMALI